MRMVAIAVVSSLAAAAHASPAGDIGKTFQAFVDSGGTSEPALELFIPPQGDSPDEHFQWPVLPTDQ
jgi:hypothetical protein